jgi:hypothetical protein
MTVRMPFFFKNSSNSGTKKQKVRKERMIRYDVEDPNEIEGN